jgi:hypothetical protein
MRRRKIRKITSIGRTLMTEPADDSEVKYADDVARLLTGPNAKAAPGRVGG